MQSILSPSATMHHLCTIHRKSKLDELIFHFGRQASANLLQCIASQDCPY